MIRFIVSFKPGGGYDAYTRMIAPHFAEALGAKSVVENWSGGKGLIAVGKILNAREDEHVIGLLLLSAFGLQKKFGESRMPDILRDFSYLARVVPNAYVIVTSGQSPYRRIEDFMNPNVRPVVGERSKVNSAVLTLAAMAEFFNMQFRAVSGFKGKQALVLSLLRGETDFFFTTFPSVRGQIESGDLRVILQMSGLPVATHPALEDVPLLLGPNGFASQQLQGQDSREEKMTSLEAIVNAFYGTGRVMVGSADWPDKKKTCFSQTMMSVLRSPALIEAAAMLQLPLDPASGSQTLQAMRSGLQVLDKHMPILSKRYHSFFR